MDLSRLGLHAEHAAALPLEEGEQLGRVARLSRGHVELLCGQEEPVQAVLPRRLRSEVVVGDWVAFLPATGAVREVLPRRTWLSRRAAGERGGAQVVCANIDTVFITTALDGDFNPRRLERYLALVHDGGAEPVVLLTKAALVEDVGPTLETAQRVAGKVTVVAIDVFANIGIATLREQLAPGATVAFVGSSGVGKSTLVNALLGDSKQRTGEVREHDRRGRHTTTTRELFMLPSGTTLIDTPGLREVGLWTDSGGIERTFADVSEVAERCRFRNCQHGGEPGCAVAEAIERGELDSERVANYTSLTGEAHSGRIWEKRAKERQFGRLQREAQRMKRRNR